MIRRRRPRPLMASINVTPLVDVMLVLLIVFMITAPLMTRRLPIDLPPSAGNNKQATENSPADITITVGNDGIITWNGQPTTLSQLGRVLEPMANKNPNKKIVIEGDQRVAYGSIMGVMTLLNEQGFRRVTLLTRAKGK